MTRDQITIRYSPFLFLKRLVIIQAFFAFLPFILALIISLFVSDLATVYERLAIARSISLEFLLTIISTGLQLLILFVAFITWYYPVYVADRERIIHNRGTFFGTVHLINTPAITNIEVRQGWLAERMGYGSLRISSSDAAGTATIRDIPDPQHHMNLIWDLVQPEIDLNPDFTAVSPKDLISAGEGQHVEFKSSLMWDYRQQRVNKDLYLPVMKNTAAFMNAGGGFVVIGVDDEGRILGLEPDFQSLNKRDKDGFENTFNNAFNKMIGVEYRQFVDVVFPDIDQQLICLLRVRPSDTPVFLMYKGEESFYIRAGNASQPLSISQAARYISRRYNGEELT
jgi:membrane protein YdbS with pleckstrin-like domain